MRKQIKVRMRTRDKLVRDLTPREAGDLLVHCHSITPERRRALLFTRGPAAAYFNAEEAAQIKEWIANEAHLEQGDQTAEHPKKPTTWCDFHGHVEKCAHREAVPV